MDWSEFIKDIANQKLPTTYRRTFISIFVEGGEPDLGLKTIEGHLKEIYKRFESESPELTKARKGKKEILRIYLQTLYANRPQLPTNPQNIPITDRPQELTTTEHIGGEKNSRINLDWHDICKKRFEENPLRRKATSATQELNCFVPLGLLERKDQPRRRQDEDNTDDLYDNVPKKVETQEDKKAKITTKVFEHEAFLTHIGLGEETDAEKTSKKNIAIIGEPGAGKTTLLQTFGEKLLATRKGLPIAISLSALGDLDLETYLEEHWLKRALGKRGNQSISDSEKDSFWAVKEQVWLLLDGADEMNAISPAQLLKHIADQLVDLKIARVILTCRINVWDANLTQDLAHNANPRLSFDTYRTLEFNDAQQDNFIREWFRLHNAPNHGELLKKELEKPQWSKAKNLGRNPLRLVLLCHIWEINESLPETKAAFYRIYLTRFYEWKKEVCDLTQDDSQQQQLHIALGDLAKAGIESKARFRLSRQLCIEKMGKDCFRLATRLGWLNIVDRILETEEPMYAFFHPTFQEYFAARAINDWRFFLPDSLEDFQGNDYPIYDARWLEIILLWFGREDLSKEDKEKFIDNAMKRDDECQDFYYYRTFFLITLICLTEFKDCSKSQSYFDQIVKFAFGEFDAEFKEWRTFLEPIFYQSINTLREANFNLYVECLCETIDNKQANEGLRIGIIKHLGEIAANISDSLTAISTLIGVIDSCFNNPDYFNSNNDQDFLLGKDKLSEAMKSLEEIAIVNDKLEARHTAIRAMIGWVKVCPNSKKKDLLYSLRKIAIDTKSKELVVNAYTDLINTSEEQDVRIRSAENLGKIASDAESKNLAMTTLIGFIDDSRNQKNTRISSARYLQRISDTDSKEVAISALIRLQTCMPDDLEILDIIINIATDISSKKFAINGLIDLIKIWFTQNQKLTLCKKTLGKLEKFATDIESRAIMIPILIDLFRMYDDYQILNIIKKSLVKLASDEDNKKIAVNGLVQLIAKFENPAKCKLTIDILMEISPNSENRGMAIKEFIRLIDADIDNLTDILTRLRKITLDETDKAIVLPKIINLTRFNFYRSKIILIEFLGDLVNNLTDEILRYSAIDILINHLYSSNYRSEVLVSLRKICGDVNSKEFVIQKLIESIEFCDEDDTQVIELADALAEITNDDQRLAIAVEQLIKLIKSSDNESTVIEASEILYKITSHDEMIVVASESV